MAEFEPITTQEEYQARFNTDIGDRLRKNEEKWAKKYEGFLSPDEVNGKTADLEKQIGELTNSLDEASKKITSFDSIVAEKDATIKRYEIDALRNRIAIEEGLSIDAVDFIKGEDENAIRTSAESLKNLMGSNKTQAPIFVNEPKVAVDEKTQALKSMLANLNLGGN